MSNALTPTPWQSRVLSIPESINLALLGGRGSGKTTLLMLLALKYSAEYGSDARTLVLRATYKSLANLYDDFVALLDVAAPGTTANKADMSFHLPNGSTIVLGNLNDQRDVRKYQGQSFGLLVVDEITNFPTPQLIDRLRANLRASEGIPTRMVVAGNPGGPLHMHIAKHYITGRVPWLPFVADDGAQWALAPSTYIDNPHLDRDRYAQQIIASAGGDRGLSAAWLENDWNQIGGAFFGSVFGEWNVFADDPNWRRPTGSIAQTGWLSGVSLDWGWAAPAVALIAVQPRLPGLRGPNGRVFPRGSWIILDEVHTARPDDLSVGKGWPPQVLAEEVVMTCRKWGVSATGVGDDARGLDNDTLLEQFREYDLFLEKPNKARIAGWTKLKSLMIGAKSNDPDTPGLFISDRTRFTLETVPLLPRDDVRLEDCDTSANDHASDAVRYLVNSPIGPSVRFGRAVGMN